MNTAMTPDVSPSKISYSRDVAIARRIAVVAGLLGFVFSVLVPLLPVVQTTATLHWPQNGQLTNVTAPLISQAPVTLTATVPCEVIQSVPPEGAMVLGLAPKDGKEASLNSLFVTVTQTRVDITDRNVVVASVPRTQIAPTSGTAHCSHIEITSSQSGTYATFVGLPDPATGEDLRSGFDDPNLRPAIVGVFTDLTGPAPPGLSVTAVIDTRFTSEPTTLKLTAMILAITATVIAVLALWRLDRTDGRRMRTWLPTRWRTITIVDVVVVGAFMLWYVIGANSSDDGYQLQMARTAGYAGYMANYFRWFGSPEDPFGWYYNLLAVMTEVSSASLWIRLPDLLCAIACWLLLSREVLPRLGPAVAASRPALWAAGLVLLAAWMPFNNGLRPEGQIATGSLVTYVLIERAIMSRRLTPAALAIFTAAFTLGIQPTGLIAVAALVAGGRPIVRILVHRHRIMGIWPLVAPLLAAATVILAIVFADQTLATVMEATRIRTAIGPAQPWYTENLRYYYLILPTVDGSLSRRFGFLITALSLFGAMFIMLRRRKVQGIARGPAWRLMGIILGTIFFLQFAPTKWVHHLGLFAALGAAMAALATVLTSQKILRSARNRMAMLTAVLFVLSLCWATTNGWWYVSSYGVPFNDDVPRIGTVTISTIFFLLCFVAALFTFWLHLSNRQKAQGAVIRVITAAPIPLAAGFMVLVFLASMTIGAARQYPTYSNAWANIRAFSGGCGLADDVLVEPDPNNGFLTPLPGDYGPLGPLGGITPVGFTANGVPERIVAESIRRTNPQPGTDADWYQPIHRDTVGINGSTVPLPYTLDPQQVPVAGSYTAGAQQESTLTSAWYQLPPDDGNHPLVAVTAAGTIAGTSVREGFTDGQLVELEYAVTDQDGNPVPAGRVQPYDLGPTPSWRNLRFARSAIPAKANTIRIVAADRSLSEGDWIALTPPRIPQLRTLQEYIGSNQPVLLDWAVGLAFPCQHPMLHAHGVTEIPRFRITPDYNAKQQSTDTWEDGRNGGPLGITDLLLDAHVMATYLAQDWGRDWGSLRAFDTIIDADTAELTLDSATRSGLWKPGQIRIKP